MLRLWFLRVAFGLAVFGCVAALLVHLATFAGFGTGPEANVLKLAGITAFVIVFIGQLMGVARMTNSTRVRPATNPPGPWWRQIWLNLRQMPGWLLLLHFLPLLLVLYSAWLWSTDLQAHGEFGPLTYEVYLLRSATPLWSALYLLAALSLGEHGLGWLARWRGQQAQGSRP